MSKNIIVKTDKRKLKRDVEKVLGNDLRKIISEIVINSDDSYKRIKLESNDNLLVDKSISISIDKNKRQVYIVDCAEGMDSIDIKRNFEFYGADKSGRSTGHKVRGLFGQGASDVLFFSASHNLLSVIKSIKNSKFYNSKFFYKDGQKGIQQTVGKSAVRDIRKRFNIKHPFNGTIVNFGLPDKVTIPNKLKNKINNFYMTRFIFNDPDRNITLKINSKSEKLHYSFPVLDDKSKIIDKDIEFIFEDKSIKGKLTIFRIEKKDENKHGELRILVYDSDKSVYDNTFFNYNNKHPGAENIFGYLELFNTAEIISEKLNQEHPEEILTDTRDGFNIYHKFYKSLAKVIDPSLSKAFEQVSSEKKENIVNFDNSKEWSNAFKDINKYFKESLEEDIGGDVGKNAPVEGIKFIRPHIKITINKTYIIKLLINTDLVPVKSTVRLSSSLNNSIEYSPDDFNVSSKEIIKDNFIVKSISIKGVLNTRNSLILSAETSNGYVAKLFIDVINKDIHYPKYGLEFWPNQLYAKPNIHSKIHLYFDTNKFPLNSKITLNSTNKKIILKKSKAVIKRPNLITDNIGVIDFELLSKEDDVEATITATCIKYQTEMNIFIRSINNLPTGSGGFFSGLLIQNSNSFWQTYFNKNNRKIVINSGNLINYLNLGEIDNINHDLKLNEIQVKYISELCSNECAKQLILKMIAGGKIEESNFESYLDEVQKQKNIFIKIFLKYLPAKYKELNKINSR